MRRWTLVAAAALVLTLVAGVLVAWRGASLADAVGDGVAAATGADATDLAPEPIVEGSTLVDARTGEAWTPRGVTWTGFATACAQGWGYSTLDALGEDGAAQEAAALAAWDVDTVRLTLNLDCWSDTGRGAPVGDAFHARDVAGYRAQVVAFVDALHAEGLAVVLSLDTRKAQGSDEVERPAFPGSASIAFWSLVGRTFADDPSVMFELYARPGEPSTRSTSTSPWVDEGALWRDGDYSHAGATALLEAVRGAGAEQPVLLAGLSAGQDLGSWLALAPADGQLVASFQPTPGGACATTSCWDREVAPVADVVPVVATEVSAGEDGTDADVARAYARWARQHGTGLLLGWWRTGAADDGSLVSDDAGSPTAWGTVAAGLLASARD
ncbi:hypothetical protein [Nocardioides sp. GY 10127]|uniref:hypothetical protein n=1 Tax=Nocardioides sp. GY 10127 TaxID=2569762 RepID=UPI0010A80BE5|nr:hypothetical protein [Nocardioides sp. GY 10127]TIC79931.1 hypothetical protein E8D37_14895 [Nocardioides sp. GY 10127]